MLCTLVKRDGGPAYFLVNVSSNAYEGTGTFRAEGKPMLYDPSAGGERVLQSERTSDARAQVTLKLRPFESVFVVFR
jgi:hypothetical protein